MQNSRNQSTRKTWRTIDYVGGGYVLQVKMDAIIEKTYRHNYSKNIEEFKSATVTEVEAAFEVDTDDDTGRINSIHQPHRVVHLSELHGVSMEDLLNDIEERGGLK